MVKKFLIISLGLSLVAQIIFSFYYSSQIITQNNTLSDNISKIQTIQKEIETLEIKLSKLTSIKTIQQLSKPLNLKPIVQTLDLNLNQ